MMRHLAAAIITIALWVQAAEAAFPQLSAAQASIGTGNSSSHSITMPATVNANDLCLLFYTLDGGGQTATFSTNLGTWTEGAYVNNEAGHYVLWLRAVGTEDGGTVTATPSGSQEFVAYVACFSGVHTTTDPEFGSASADTATPNPPSLNPANWDVEDTTWVSSASHDLGGLTLTSCSSGYTNNFDQDSGGSGGVGHAFCTRESAAASEDPGVVTFSASDGTGAFTVGLRPAPAGGGGGSTSTIIRRRITKHYIFEPIPEITAFREEMKRIEQ